MADKDKKDTSQRKDDVILLEDLQPKKDVKGGASKFLFGESGGKPDIVSGKRGSKTERKATKN